MFPFKLGKYGHATPGHIFTVRCRWKTQPESYSTSTGGHSTCVGMLCICVKYVRSNEESSYIFLLQSVSHIKYSATVL